MCKSENSRYAKSYKKCPTKKPHTLLENGENTMQWCYMKFFGFSDDSICVCINIANNVHVYCTTYTYPL